MKKNLLKWILPSLILFSACKKDDKVTPEPSIKPTKGIYILSEGRFGQNETKLAYRDTLTGTVKGDFFLQQNPSITGGLGDTGNDILIYGSKMYIVVNGSGNVTVLNAADATYRTQISFGGTTANKNPRFAIGAKGKVFVTAWDNTVSIIDTTSLAITSTIPVGPGSEGIAVAGNYLYVANSGSTHYPDYDSTVSVIDLNTMAEITKITVGLNQQKVEVNSAGDVYVSAYGDAFATVPVPASVSVINSATNTLKATLSGDYQYDHLRVVGDLAYFYNNYGGTAVKVYNTVTNALVRSSFVTDGTAITSVYGVDVDEENGDVYITDAKDYQTSGEVTCFNSNGVKKFSFSVAPGISPNRVLFLR